MRWFSCWVEGGFACVPVDKNVRNPTFAHDDPILFIVACRWLVSVDKPDV